MQLLYFYSFFLALLSSLILIPILIKYAASLRLVDDPVGSSRKLHKNPMPRSGGLGIIIPAAIALLIVLPLDDSIFSFLFSSLIIISFGLIDDIVELKPLQKLAGQALGVSLAIIGGMVISDVPFIDNCPIWICYALTFCFVMGVINGVNFSDGMDGLAAGTALMALVLIFILAVEGNNTEVATIAMAICAALVGFLRFNTHPATIFMGDAGSQFLGFSIAWLAITLSQNSAPALSMLIPLLILGIPIIDVLQVIPVRIRKKLPLPGPDKEHFHHHIFKLGFHQSEVVVIIYILQAILLLGAYALRFESDAAIFAFYILYAAMVLSVVYLATVRNWRVRAQQSLEDLERRNPVFRKLSFMHSYSGKFYGIVISLLLILFAVMSTTLPSGLIYIALVLASGLLCAKFLSNDRWTMTLGRLSTYTATTFAVYGMTLSTDMPQTNWLIDGVLIALTVILAISIRTTRKEYFWLTPQDLLVVFFVILLAPYLALDLGPGIHSGALIFRTVLLLYTCEYVLARGVIAQKRLTMTAIVALFTLGVHL